MPAGACDPLAFRLGRGKSDPASIFHVAWGRLSMSLIFGSSNSLAPAGVFLFALVDFVNFDGDCRCGRLHVRGLVAPVL